MKSDRVGKGLFGRRFRSETVPSRGQGVKSVSVSAAEEKVRSISEKRDGSKELRDEPAQSSFGGSSMLEPVIVTVTGDSTEVDDDYVVVQKHQENLNSITNGNPTVQLQPKGLFSSDAACCATNAFKDSFFENVFCGVDDDRVRNTPLHSAIPSEIEYQRILCRPHSLTSDPRIQEAVECMFASQLESGRPLSLVDGECQKIRSKESSIVAPSGLQQIVIRNRTYSTLKNPLMQQNSTPATTENSFHEVPALVSVSESSSTTGSNSCKGLESQSSHQDAYVANGHCRCQSRFSPFLKPDLWPQRPLLLRPTPGGRTRIKGVRYAESRDYIWDASGSKVGWHDELRRKWGRQMSEITYDSMCPHCVVLPINNGNETDGESLVTDFESDLFDGSLLVRIRGAEGTTSEPYDDTKGYFSDVNRKYQVVIQGRFKKSILWTDCVSGIRYVMSIDLSSNCLLPVLQILWFNRLNRPCGKLPSKWIIKSALNLVKFFAPHLDAKIDGPNPHTFSPLGSTPQTIIVDNSSAPQVVDIAGSLKEPTDAQHTLMQQPVPCSASTIQRARHRKKSFDKIFSDKDRTFATDINKIYTFEFLQHLINFDDLSVTIGSVFGSISLDDVLDGQPIQILARHHDENLWSFDVWHELLYADSMKYEKDNLD
jgi:Protein of unknown function (DUF1769)